MCDVAPNPQPLELRVAATPAPSSRSRTGSVAVIGGSAASTITLSAVATWSGNYLPAVIAASLPLLVFACVVCPAVWSRNVARRRAALAVLELLLGRDRPEKLGRRGGSSVGAGAAKGAWEKRRTTPDRGSGTTDALHRPETHRHEAQPELSELRNGTEEPGS